jgi:hypothetical protein
MEWLNYPQNKPESSVHGSKTFYYAVMSDSFFSDDEAYKCWYNDGYWLCDRFRSIVRVKRFTPCAKNAKHELTLNQ